MPPLTFIGSLLIVIGIVIPPMIHFYSPNQILVWLGMYLFLIGYNKQYKYSKIIKYGRNGLIAYVAIWIIAVVSLFLFPNDQNIFSGKLFNLLTQPASTIFNLFFPIPLKPLSHGSLLVDESYLRKSVSLLSNIFVYICSGFLVGYIVDKIKKSQPTSG
jgi:hypothetical protein